MGMLKLYDTCILVAGGSQRPSSNATKHSRVLMGLEMLFTYIKWVILLVGRMVEKMLHMGFPHVDLSNGDQQLLSTKSVDDTIHEIPTDERVFVSNGDQWEAGGRDLLDEKNKRSHDISSSSTEDELIELSDEEERPASIMSLVSSKRSSFYRPLSSSTQTTSSDSTAMFL